MTLYIILLYMNMGIMLTLAVQAWFQRASRGSLTLFFFLLSVGVASFAYAMNLYAPTLEQKLFWNRVEYLGGAFIPVLMLVAVLGLTGRERWLRPGPLTALLLIPFVTLLANWSNEWHGLYYTSTWLTPSGEFLILAKSRGPLYALAFGYVYCVVILALVLIVRDMHRYGIAARPQLVLLLAAFIVPLLINIPYTFRLIPHKHINLTLAGFFCSGILLSIAIFRFQLISAIPLNMEERNQLLLNHAHALLYTISPDGIMTYVTPNWPLMLGHTPNEVMGRHFGEFVVPEDHGVCNDFLARVITTGELQTGVEYRVRHKHGHVVWHASSVIPVTDRKGHLRAYVGAAHDITNLKQAQQELSEANTQLSELITAREDDLRQAISETLTAAENEARRIGDDIHDGLCQDLVGLAHLAEKAAAGAPGGMDMKQVGEHAARLAGVARAFSHDLTLHELDIQTLPEALDTLARRTDRIFHTETELNLTAPIAALTHEQNLHIYRIIREAVNNAVKHAHPQRLWIDLVHEPQQLVVSVSNDGRPPPAPNSLIEGLGMKQMRMRARLLGGKLMIQQNRQNLTVLELIIPLEGDYA